MGRGEGNKQATWKTAAGQLSFYSSPSEESCGSLGVQASEYLPDI